MDPKAIEYGELVGETYKILPGNLTNSAGKQLTVGGTQYMVVTTIYANDLATDINSVQAEDEVSIGLICRGDHTGDVVIAIRGTEGILEWVQDASFGLVPCPFLVGAGETEDGFTAMYTSLSTGTAVDSPKLVDGLAALPFSVDTVTICGYSLGGALATLLALDLAAHPSKPAFAKPAVYTYGSPRVGDPLFAATFNQAVTNSTRIENRLDIVPKLPPFPLYQHVLQPLELNPGVLVQATLTCEHSLATYLHLLSLDTGGHVLPLEPACQPSTTATS